MLAANMSGYRDWIMEEMEHLDSTTSFGENRYWTVVYAVATPKQGAVASSLYFLSKVALYHAAQQLRALAVGVAMPRIPM